MTPEQYANFVDNNGIELSVNESDWEIENEAHSSSYEGHLINSEVNNG